MPNFQPDAFGGGAGKPILDKQRIIDAVKEEPPEKRVAKLVELGVLTDLEGYTWGTASARFFVFTNVKGIPVPMYKSLAYTDNKRSDLNFFIFYGCAPNGWFIKGNLKGGNEFYGIRDLENVSGILTSVFDFDTSRRIGSEDEVVEGYVPQGKEIPNYETLNEVLGKRFGIDYSKIDVLSYPSMWASSAYETKNILDEVRKAFPDKK